MTNKTDRKKKNDKLPFKPIEMQPIFDFRIFLMKVMIPFTILLIVFAIDAADGEIDDGYLQTNFYIFTALLILFLAGVVFPLKKISSRKTSYIFDRDKITHLKNFPNMLKSEIQYRNIKEVVINKGMLQKKFGLGNITLIAKKDSGQDDLTLHNLNQLNDLEMLINRMSGKKSLGSES